MARTSVALLSSLSVLLMMIDAQTTNPNLSPNSCGPDREYTQCGCPLSCNNLRPRCHNHRCKSGCFCKNGTIEDGHGNCVKKEECCSGNTTYSDCGNDCDRVCPSHFSHRKRCWKNMCFPGCFCNPGYVRLGHSKKCVLPEKCPRDGHRPKPPHRHVH